MPRNVTANVYDEVMLEEYLPVVIVAAIMAVCTVVLLAWMRRSSGQRFRFWQFSLLQIAVLTTTIAVLAWLLSMAAIY